MPECTNLCIFAMLIIPFSAQIGALWMLKANKWYQLVKSLMGMHHNQFFYFIRARHCPKIWINMFYIMVSQCTFLIWRHKMLEIQLIFWKIRIFLLYRYNSWIKYYFIHSQKFVDIEYGLYKTIHNFKIFNNYLQIHLC